MISVNDHVCVICAGGSVQIVGTVTALPSTTDPSKDYYAVTEDVTNKEFLVRNYDCIEILS